MPLHMSAGRVLVYSRHMVDLTQSLSGFVVGVIVGLTGVGGGSLMTPVLVLLFGIHPATAVGTDLLYAAVTKTGGTWVHARLGHVDWRVTGLLAAGSLPAALLTLTTLHSLAHGAANAKVITLVLGIALLSTAASLVWRSRSRDQPTPDIEPVLRHPAWTIVTGAVLGVVVSLSSVGAGALGITALYFIYPQMRAVRLVASDLAHAVPLTLVAGTGHWMLGNVDWHLLASLLIGSLPGIYLGSRFASRVSERGLRLLLAMILVVVGVRLVASS